MRQKQTFQRVCLPDGTEVQVNVEKLVARALRLKPNPNQFTAKQRDILIEANIRILGDAFARPLKELRKDMIRERGQVQGDRVYRLLKEDLEDLGFRVEGGR